MTHERAEEIERMPKFKDVKRTALELMIEIGQIDTAEALRLLGLAILNAKFE